MAWSSPLCTPTWRLRPARFMRSGTDQVFIHSHAPVCAGIFYVVLVKMCFGDFPSSKRTDAHVHFRHHQDRGGIGAKTIVLEWLEVHPSGSVKPDASDAEMMFFAVEALCGVGGCTRRDRMALQALDGTMSREVLRVWRRSCLGHGSACLDNGEGSRCPVSRCRLVRRSLSLSRTTPCRGRIPCSSARRHCDGEQQRPLRRFPS